MLPVTLLVILALAVVLLNRLGVFARLRARRNQQAFEKDVLALGEEVAWKDHVQRMDRRLPAIHKMPSITFKMGRER